jgi:hypothetical protein
VSACHRGACAEMNAVRLCDDGWRTQAQKGSEPEPSPRHCAGHLQLVGNLPGWRSRRPERRYCRPKNATAIANHHRQTMWMSDSLALCETPQTSLRHRARPRCWHEISWVIPRDGGNASIASHVSLLKRDLNEIMDHMKITRPSNRVAKNNSLFLHNESW